MKVNFNWTFCNRITFLVGLFLSYSHPYTLSTLYTACTLLSLNILAWRFYFFLVPSGKLVKTSAYSDWWQTTEFISFKTVKSFATLYEGCSKSFGPLVGKNTVIYLDVWNPIPFKVVSLVMHTLLPAVLPLPSRRSCFCSTFSSFGTNFADTLLKPKYAT